MRSWRDLAAVEDALAEAFAKALETWPVSGVPDQPDAWMLVAARAKARINMVFQHFNLFEHLLARENVAIAPISIYNQDRVAANRTAATLPRDVGLGDHLEHLLHRQSGRQQQRIPELMLFDEPTSALDPKLVGEVPA